MSDEEAAIIQAKENDKSPVSEYSKGLVLTKLQKDNNYTQQKLSELTGISRRKIQNLLCYAKVDEEIWNAVANMAKVSPKSAEAIYTLSQKSNEHKKALIEIAEDIRKGAGAKRIEKLISEIVLGKDNDKKNADLIQSKAGLVFAEWNKNKLAVAKDVEFDKNAFSKHILKFFERNM